MIKTLKDIDFENKKVILRIDLNVPINNKKIEDTTRINAVIPTIKYLVKQKAKIIIMSHLGKVQKESDFIDKTLEIVCNELSNILEKTIIFVNAIEGEKLEQSINTLLAGQIIMIQNTRFADITNANGDINLEANRESKNNSELGKYWAKLADVFVNDAFGTAHRSHASNVGIASNIKESCIGFLIEKELTMLSKITDNPEKPLAIIVGGAKVSDKITIMNNLITKADYILIGGGMAFTFLKALGYHVGKSILESKKIDTAKKYLNLKSNCEIVLPLDFAESLTFSNSEPRFTKDRDINDAYMGLDIGPKTIELFKEKLADVKTVFWNGPMGVFEFSNYSTGTRAICEIIVNLKKAFTCIGGGDSASAAHQMGYDKKISHISTGGGASLQFIEGEKLPAIEAIQKISK